MDAICDRVVQRLGVNEMSVGENAQPGAAQPAAPGKSYSLIVKGANESLSSMEVKRRIVESVGGDTNLKVKGIRQMKNGGVVVEAATEEDRKRLARCPLGDAGLRADAPRRLDPRVIVYDFPSSVTDDTLLEELDKRNLDGLVRSEELKKKVRIVRREKKGKDAKVGNVVIEMPSECKEKLLKNGRVYVGLMSYRVRVCEKVLRCHGCMLFDHRVSDCKSERVCYKCGEVGHQARECRSPEVCVNCKRRNRPADHSSLSTECPEFVWRLNLFRKRVNG